MCEGARCNRALEKMSHDGVRCSMGCEAKGPAEAEEEVVAQYSFEQLACHMRLFGPEKRLYHRKACSASQLR